jgi:hypothetical protein
MYRKEEIEIITISGCFHAHSVPDAVEHQCCPAKL